MFPAAYGACVPHNQKIEGYTAPSKEICDKDFILQISTTAGGRNMKKPIISTAAKMTKAIVHGDRMVCTIAFSSLFFPQPLELIYEQEKQKQNTEV